MLLEICTKIHSVLCEASLGIVNEDIPVVVDTDASNIAASARMAGVLLFIGDPSTKSS